MRRVVARRRLRRCAATAAAGLVDRRRQPRCPSPAPVRPIADPIRRATDRRPPRRRTSHDHHDGDDHHGDRDHAGVATATAHRRPPRTTHPPHHADAAGAAPTSPRLRRRHRAPTAPPPPAPVPPPLDDDERCDSGDDDDDDGDDDDERRWRRLTTEPTGRDAPSSRCRGAARAGEHPRAHRRRLPRAADRRAGVAVLVTRQVQLARVDREIEQEQAQEVEELRRLADGIDPATGEPFGDDVDAIFDTFLDRNVPSDDEAFYTLIGEPPVSQHRRATAVRRPAVPGARGASARRRRRRRRRPTVGGVGEVRSLAVPLAVDGADRRRVRRRQLPADDQREVAERGAPSSRLAGLAVLALSDGGGVVARRAGPAPGPRAHGDGPADHRVRPVGAHPGRRPRRAGRARRHVQRHGRPARRRASRPSAGSSTTSPTSCARRSRSPAATSRCSATTRRSGPRRSPSSPTSSTA